jgi:hypothetical protein
VSKKPKKSASVIGDRKYYTTRIRDKDGKLRFSRGNGDAVAKAMLLFKSQGGEIEQVVRANKLEDRMKGKSKMQDGLKRMCVGVMLRALVRNGTPVKIGKVLVGKLTQKVEMPKVDGLPRRSEAKASAAKPKSKPAAKKAVAPRKRKPKTEPVDETLFEFDFDDDPRNEPDDQEEAA